MSLLQPWLLVLGLLAVTRAVSAHGALPAVQQLLVPPDAADPIIVGTNFGLINSADAGMAGDWMCETAAKHDTASYQLGAGVEPSLYAFTPEALEASRDGGCSWTPMSTRPGSWILELSADRIAADRIWLISTDSATGTTSSLSYVDAGEQPTEVLSAEPGWELWSVFAAGDRVYTVANPSKPGAAELFSSADAGQTWVKTSLPKSFDSARVKLASATFGDRPELIVRLMKTNGDELARSTDGGTTFTQLGGLPGYVRGIARGEQQTFALIAGNAGGSTLAVIDSTFERAELRPSPYTLRDVGFREGLLYALVDELEAPGPLLVSRDQGRSFEQALALDSVVLRRRCEASALCKDQCTLLADMRYLSPKACSNDAEAPVGTACTTRPRGGRNHDRQWTTGATLVLAHAVFWRRRRQRAKSATRRPRQSSSS